MDAECVTFQLEELCPSAPTLVGYHLGHSGIKKPIKAFKAERERGRRLPERVNAAAKSHIKYHLSLIPYQYAPQARKSTQKASPPRTEKRLSS
jgi:hypothetical protein